MEFRNDKGNYLKDGFAVPDFAEYTEQRLEKLGQKIAAPCYAMEGQQACLDRLHEHIREDPYRWFESRSDLAAQQAEMRKAESLTRLSDPLLYECVQDARAALAVKSLTAFAFTHDGELRYTATAMGHTDMTWLFISRHFHENGLLSDLELCFLIGRTLGYAQTHRADVVETQELTPEQHRAYVLTADRAGFLAVLWRALRMYPSLPADELVTKASDASIQAMRKLSILYALKKKDLEYPQLALQQGMQKSPAKRSYAKKNDLLPTLWERMEALPQFAGSIPFVRCISTLWGEANAIVRSCKCFQAAPEER